MRHMTISLFAFVVLGFFSSACNGGTSPTTPSPMEPPCSTCPEGTQPPKMDPVPPNPSHEAYYSPAGLVQVGTPTRTYSFPAGAFSARITVRDPAMDFEFTATRFVTLQVYHSLAREVDSILVPVPSPPDAPVPVNYTAVGAAVYRDNGEEVSGFSIPGSGGVRLLLGDVDKTKGGFTSYIPGTFACGRVVDLRLQWRAELYPGQYGTLGDGRGRFISTIIPLGWRQKC